LETPLAPIFAFFIFTEVPGTATLIGGAVVLVAVLLSIKDESKPEVALTEEGTHP
jgi:drug/metabolite transporter (DMT)-like permease